MNEAQISNNHPGRGDAARLGREIAAAIRERYHGLAVTRIHGQFVETNKAWSRFYVGDQSIAVANVAEHLTAAEVRGLLNLPEWDGSNSWQISGIVLQNISQAIARFHQLVVTDEDGRRCIESIVGGEVKRDYNY